MKTIREILNYEVPNDAVVAEEQDGFAAELQPTPSHTLTTDTKLLLMNIAASEQLG